MLPPAASLFPGSPAPPQTGARPGSQDSPGERIRQATGAELAAALRESRADTLRTFAAFERALHRLQVPMRPDVNPPLWELGHIGWFQEWWVARNPHRTLGTRADPEVVRPEGVRAGADALYNSSRVAHDSRWTLDLPDPAATRDDLARQLDATLALLAQDAQAGDDALYFHRLALLHEDMHHEAAIYTAQTLGIDLDDARWRPTRDAAARTELHLPAAQVRLGRPQQHAGFAFDNEVGREDVVLDAYAIDSRAVSWGEYLPFVDSGAWLDKRWWTARGLAWREGAVVQERGGVPLALKREGSLWLRRRGSRFEPLDLDEPACHLTQHEAQAWCAWAGRRLPTEAEWEHAAATRPDEFRWGAVWEWTATPFHPFEGFEPHPYRDYSAPWFDGRPVLRGASFATQPRMRNLRYRNFFPPERSDVPAGFRSCAR